MVKAVTLEFFSIKQFFIIDIHAKLGTPNLPQVFYKTKMEEIPIFRFLIKSRTNKHFYNSRNSNDIDMKTGPVSKLDKRNTSKFKQP